MERLTFLLKEYAACLRLCGLELNVEDLFQRGLGDQGFFELERMINAVSEQEVRDLATCIFSPDVTPPLLFRQDADALSD